MPKVSIYLPDDLYRQARDRQLPVSALAQEAIEAALRRASSREWLEGMRTATPLLTTPLDISAVMAAVRDEDFGT